MKITGFDLYPLPFAFVSGGYTTAYGTRARLDNLLLVVHTNDGLDGLGEICRRAGDSPLPTGAQFSRECLSRLARIIGADPLDPERARARLGPLDDELSNLACALDTACFDLCAQAAELPLWRLLGDRQQDSVPVYHTIGQGLPNAMAAEAQAAQRQGCRVVQAKVAGGDGITADIACIDALLAVLRDDAVILADANGGWDVDSARTVIGHFPDARIYWEEPCKTYPENRRVAEIAAAAVILDQCVTGPELALQACRDGAVRGMGIKCTIQGGLRAGQRSRDVAIEQGMQLKVDDSWSADVATTASLHLAMAVPPGQLIASVDMRPYFERRISTEGPSCENYRFAPNALPGLGLVAELESLGPPLA
jgi:L-alanine-DL-glutamate epimerase-like enolase superfamily enzyme